MAQAHDTHAHHGPDFKLYMVVAFALSVFTITSFIFNYMYRTNFITANTSFLLILGVAIIKAVLVGMYFMHLKFEWGKLYFMIIPAFILAAMFAVVLLPDIVLGWQPSHSLAEPPVSTTGTR
jgi:cytochrome c oxidase subunit 4